MCVFFSCVHGDGRWGEMLSARVCVCVCSRLSAAYIVPFIFASASRYVCVQSFTCLSGEGVYSCSVYTSVYTSDVMCECVC